MRRTRIAFVISPAVALLAFWAFVCLAFGMKQPNPGDWAKYALVIFVLFGLPITYGIVAVTLYPPFRVLRTMARPVRPRAVLSTSALTGALGGMGFMFNPWTIVQWPVVGLSTLCGGIAGLVGGLVFAYVGGLFDVTRRAS